MEARWQDYLKLGAWSLVLFALCYLLNTRHNRFPFFYHPDEPRKVEQVMTGDWNYHHPMLLLTTTKLAVDGLNVPKKEQRVVETGRRVSAAFMAAAVVAFSLLAYLWRGWAAAFTAGLALMMHHQCYELAHYMKEDSALLMGVSFAFLAALAYSQAPSSWRAVVLGASVGLAISGKYIGVVVLGVALPVIWFHSEGKRPARYVYFTLVLVAVIAAVNLPLLLHPETFRHSLDREMESVIEGQGDVTRRVPHALYWNVFIDNTTPLIWLFLVGFFVIRWHRRDGLTLTQRLIAGFPIAFTLLLSFSPKENDRYFLPATALFTFIACLGAIDSPRLVQAAWKVFGLPHPERAMSGRWRTRAVAVAIFALVALQVVGWGKPGWISYDAAFQRDDKADLIAWMHANLPADAVVAADGTAGLVDPKKKKNLARRQAVTQKLLVSKLAADFGTIEELHGMGVNYVVVSESSYGKFFRSDLRAKDDKDQKYTAGRAFYEHLLREEEPLFDRERGTVIYLHPGIRVYAMPEAHGA